MSAGWSNLSPSKPVALVLSKLKNVTNDSNGWNAMCPVHDDQKNSLSISHGDDGKAILTCHAGCEVKDIVAKIALQMKDLFMDASKKKAVTYERSAQAPGEPVAIYSYTDKRGRVAYQKLRFEPKDFRVRRPDGNGGWIYKGPEADAPRYLYRLAEFLKRSEAGRKAICLVEGEQDADTLWDHKIPATTGIGGAAERWHAEYVEQLKDAGVERIVVFPDNDPPGHKHAEKVAAAYYAVGLVVRVVHLPVPEKGDVSDYLAAGRSVDELKALCAAAPEWTPSATPAPKPAGEAELERSRFAAYTDVPYDSLFYGPDEVEEPLDYHWDSFAVRGSVVTIIGAKKHAKSWFADLLMASAAAPEPLFPGFPSGGQRVLLLNGPRENSAHEPQRRLRAIHRQFGITSGSGGEIRVRCYRRAALRLDDGDGLFEALLAYVADFKPHAIRIDSSGAFWGGKNEGDNTEVREWMEKRADVLLQHAAPGCTLYMLAHTGHAIRDGKVTYSTRHQRGASAWGDATDTLLMVEKGKAPEGAPDHHVVSTLSMEYTRLGPETSRQIQLTISGGPGTGHELGVALDEVLPAIVDPTDTEKALRIAVEALQKATVQRPVTQSGVYKILKAAGLGRDVVREALFVLRGSAPWTAGQYKGTRRALVREDGKWKNSPVLVWIGHSGEMWDEPAGDE